MVVVVGFSPDTWRSNARSQFPCVIRVLQWMEQLSIFAATKSVYTNDKGNKR